MTLQAKELTDFMNDAYIMARKLRLHAESLRTEDTGAMRALHCVADDLFDAVQGYDQLTGKYPRQTTVKGVN